MLIDAICQEQKKAPAAPRAAFFSKPPRAPTQTKKHDHHRSIWALLFSRHSRKKSYSANKKSRSRWAF
jgi:hypothetical protein